MQRKRILRVVTSCSTLAARWSQWAYRPAVEIWDRTPDTRVSISCSCYRLGASRHTARREGCQCKFRSRRIERDGKRLADKNDGECRGQGKREEANRKPLAVRLEGGQDALRQSLAGEWDKEEVCNGAIALSLTLGRVYRRATSFKVSQLPRPAASARIGGAAFFFLPSSHHHLSYRMQLQRRLSQNKGQNNKRRNRRKEIL